MITSSPVTEVAAKVSAGRPRRWAHLQNRSDVPIAIKYDSSETELTFANGILLAPGATLLLANGAGETNYYGDIWAIVEEAPGADKVLVVHEE